MRIYTKKGDGGGTSLIDGVPLSKADPRLHFLGTLDELNSHLGLLKTMTRDEGDLQFLRGIQKNIVMLSAHGADPENNGYIIEGAELHILENKIDELQKLYPAQKQFILPGENSLSAHIDIARTVARRAERHLAEAAGLFPIHFRTSAYLNRLSDYLYVWARYQDYVEKLAQSVLEQLSKKRTENTVLMNSKLAQAILQRVEAKAAEMGLAAVVAVCDGAGNPVAVHAMDGAFLISFDVALSKAYTAVALKMPTEELNRLTQPGQMFYGLDSFDGKKICVIGGGVPLYAGSQIIGGLGVSGGTPQQDILLAQYGWDGLI